MTITAVLPSTGNSSADASTPTLSPALTILQDANAQIDHAMLGGDYEYNPLTGLEDSDFWQELQNSDPMSIDAEGFKRLIELAPTTRAKSWLAGFRDCRHSMACIAGVEF